MSRHALPGALCLLFVVGMGLGPLRAQEQPKGVKKVNAPKTEDAIRRAVLRAKHEDGQVLERVTAAPQNDSTYLVVVEYANGDFGLFVGDEDPANDAFALIDSRNIDVIGETILRARPKSHH